MAECTIHLVPLRDGACWACAWGQEPQTRCPIHGPHATSLGHCPDCRLRGYDRPGAPRVAVESTPRRLTANELATLQREMEWRVRLRAAGYRVADEPWTHIPVAPKRDHGR